MVQPLCQSKRVPDHRDNECNPEEFPRVTIKQQSGFLDESTKHHRPHTGDSGRFALATHRESPKTKVRQPRSGLSRLAPSTVRINPCRSARPRLSRRLLQLFSRRHRRNASSCHSSLHTSREAACESIWDNHEHQEHDEVHAEQVE